MTPGLHIRFGVEEPIHGAAMRLGTRHEAASLDEFLLDWALSLTGVASGRQADAFARLAGAPDGAIARSEVDVGRRTVRIAGETLLLNDWSLSERRWCPRCLDDDRETARRAGAPLRTACRHRAEWDLRSTASCARHGVALAGSCPRCGGMQDWHGPAVDRCACGGDLAEAPCRSLGPGEGTSDAYVQGRLGASPRISCAMLDGADLKDALASAERLGWAVLAGRRDRAALVDREARAIARDAGMSAIADWPRSFRLALDSAFEARPADAPDGLLAAYGWIYSEWAYLPPRSDLDRAVRDELALHAAANAVVAADEPLFGAEGSAAVNMTEAARTMGMGYARARSVLDGRGAIPPGVRRGVAFPLRPEDVPGPVGRPAPGRAAQERLGVGRKQARAMRRALSDGSADLAWVDGLLAAARRGVPEVDVVAAGLSPLPGACRSAGVGLVVACRALLDGRLRPVAVRRDRAALTGVLVRAGDVRALRAGEPVSVEAAAAMLDLHHEAARWLVREGTLTARPGRRTRCIEIGSIAAFDADFASSARLAKERGGSSRSVVHALTKGSVAAVFGPPACRQCIFRREEVESALPTDRTHRPITVH